MDYKELIDRYRSYATRWERGEQLLLNGEIRIQDTLRDAATAIETLLAERDAAVEGLRHGEKPCKSCTYCEKDLNDYPCRHCYVMGGMDDNWEWRCQQKEGESDA